MQSEVPVVKVGGKKAVMYVVSCGAYFSSGARKVVLRALGRRISTAVDVSQLMVRTFSWVRIRDVMIGTVEVEGKDGRKRSVSSMEIVLEKTTPDKSRRTSK